MTLHLHHHMLVCTWCKRGNYISKIYNRILTVGLYKIKKKKNPTGPQKKTFLRFDLSLVSSHTRIYVVETMFLRRSILSTSSYMGQTFLKNVSDMWRSTNGSRISVIAKSMHLTCERSIHFITKLDTSLPICYCWYQSCMLLQLAELELVIEIYI